MSDQTEPLPPRNGEGDRAQRGGGVRPNVLKAPRASILRARRERRSGNPAEVILWRILRSRPGGRKFRRQHHLGEYSLDFACLEARLCIEIDGEAHERGDRPERDAKRDAWLAKHGFKTLRLPARLVFDDPDAALAAIVLACEAPRSSD